MVWVSDSSDPSDSLISLETHPIQGQGLKLAPDIQPIRLFLVSAGGEVRDQWLSDLEAGDQHISAWAAHYKVIAMHSGIASTDEDTSKVLLYVAPDDSLTSW